MATITISKSDLLGRLSALSRIISSKPALPIMENILFEAEAGKLRLTATDSQGSIETEITNVTLFEDFSICYNARLLIDALRTLPEQPISIFINQETFQTQIKYKGGKFELMGVSSEGFTKTFNINDPIEVEMPTNELLKGITNTVPFTAIDDLRPILNAVFVEIKENVINFVATDSNYMSLLEHTDETQKESTSFTLPQKIATLIKHIIPTSDSVIKVFIGTNKVRFEHESYSIVATLIEGRFPNYRSVIPTNNDKVMKIKTADFKSALNRILVFASQSSRLVKFVLTDNQLNILSQDIDFSTGADEKVECEYSNNQLAIGFNGDKLSLILSIITTDELIMSFSGPMKAALISPVDESSSDNLTYLLMPMMLND